MSPADAAIGLAWGTIHQANLTESIEAAARHGFPTLQIPPDLYYEAREQGLDAAALRRRMADAGVTVRVIDGITRGMPGMPTEPVVFKGREMARLDAASCIEVADALGSPIVNVSHFMAEPRPLEETAGAVADACRMAAARGITVVLEFVPNSGNPSLGHARAVVEACGEPNCGILLDTWHLMRSGGTVDEVRALPAGMIGAFQLSDRKDPPAGTPYVPMTGRLLPGEGEWPLAEIVAAALENNPAISLEVEVFSEELAALPLDAAAARTAEAVRAWRAGLSG